MVTALAGAAPPGDGILGPLVILLLVIGLARWRGHRGAAVEAWLRTPDGRAAWAKAASRHATVHERPPVEIRGTRYPLRLGDVEVRPVRRIPQGVAYAVPRELGVHFPVYFDATLEEAVDGR